MRLLLTYLLILYSLRHVDHAEEPGRFALILRNCVQPDVAAYGVEAQYEQFDVVAYTC
jgi:hypothetical protein